MIIETAESVAREMDKLNADWSDPEACHSAEDDLMLIIIRATAEGHPEAQALARAFVERYDPEQTRWYA